MRMNEDQAGVLWELLRSVVSTEAKIDKHELWKDVEKILGEDARMERAIGNNNNE